MSTQDTGGSAFPTPKYEMRSAGMTLRDYFAAKAMEGSIVDATLPPAYTYADKAKYAYQMADAMLKARTQ